MRIFERMRAFRALEDHHVPSLKTGLNRHFIAEIGYHQAKGKPLTLKQLLHLDIGSVATVQRRLRQLRRLGLVQHRRATRDRRTVELVLSPKCVRIFGNYDSLITSNAAPGGREPRHLFGLCSGETGCRNLVAKFLAKGLNRGHKCLLIAPAEAQKEILMRLTDRRKAPRQLVVSEGYDSADAHLRFVKRVFQEAKRAGQPMHLAADMSWTLAKKIPFDVLLDIVKRFDAMASRQSLTALNIFDTRRFSSCDLLRVMKCHRDHKRVPIVLG
jgi:hypothetical protein